MRRIISILIITDVYFIISFIYGFGLLLFPFYLLLLVVFIYNLDIELFKERLTLGLKDILQFIRL